MREKTLQLAREQFPLNFNGKAIHILPDFPTKVVKQRQVFQDVRKRLMDAEAPCSFYYPARLQVTHGSMVKAFTTPREAEDFLGTIQEGISDISFETHCIGMYVTISFFSQLCWH